MRRLLLVTFLVLSLGLCSFAYSDELVAPFTKAKQIVEERGKEVEPGVKQLIFTINGDTITFITIDNGSVGIVVETSAAGLLVAYDTEAKVYFSVSKTFEGISQPTVVSQTDATSWAFGIFRFLVEKGLI